TFSFLRLRKKQSHDLLFPVHDPKLTSDSHRFHHHSFLKSPCIYIYLTINYNNCSSIHFLQFTIRSAKKKTVATFTESYFLLLRARSINTNCSYSPLFPFNHPPLR
ncbi:unnamed protein product, partial [Arabidopsis halleri]